MLKHFNFRIDKKTAEEQKIKEAIEETNEGILSFFYYRMLFDLNLIVTVTDSMMF